MPATQPAAKGNRSLCIVSSVRMLIAARFRISTGVANYTEWHVPHCGDKF
jgi:hypothetical protein